MELDYIKLARLVDIRKEQIKDVSLEYDYFNEEYLELEKIRIALAKLILLERDTKRLAREMEERNDSKRAESKETGNL